MDNKKYALITGGSTGLGFAFSKQLAKEGYVPILIARREEKLKEAVANIKGEGFEAYYFQGDITSIDSLTNIYNSIKERFLKIDFLILNAGVVSVGLLEDYTDFKALKKDIDIDLWGVILATKIFRPLMDEGSKILMISSALGLLGAAGYSTYCAAKAGVINFAASIRCELLRKKISVHVACPADIDTPQYEYEKNNMPSWMSASSTGRKNVLSPKDASRRILKGCNRRKFLITINFEIKLLLFLKRVLPEKVMNFILDLSLPRP